MSKTAGGRKSPQPAASASTTNKAPSNVTCARTDFAFLSLKGALVTAFLRSGTRLEGIFDTLDHDRRIVSLKLVREFPLDGGEEARSEGAVASFALEELDLLTSEPINFSEAVGGQAFATDAEISGKAGPLRERELARWEGGADANVLGSLEEEAGPPGVGWDQFDANRRLFGVEPSFDEAQYTTMIDRNSEEYQRLEREAERLATEITGSNAGGTNVHLAEERGIQVDDTQINEEDRYGAVVRSSSAVSNKTPTSKSPASFREAALSGNNPVVTMPRSTTSASSAGKSGQSSGGQLSPTTPEQELEAPVPLPPSTRPRKSIANLHVDPTALEQARESVNQATDAMQRRMSQVQADTAKDEQIKQPSLNPNAVDFVPGASLAPISSADASVAAAPSTQPVLPHGTAAQGGISKPITFNPNAAAYVPSAVVATPAYRTGTYPNPYPYGYNPYYAPHPYQQPYAGTGGAGYYNQNPYYNPYQYHYRYPNQGAYQQQQPPPNTQESQQKEHTAPAPYPHMEAPH